MSNVNKKPHRGVMIGGLVVINAALVVILVSSSFIKLPAVPEPVREASAQEWVSWAEITYQDALKNLETQGVTMRKNPDGSKRPVMLFVDGKPTLGNAEVDDALLSGQGELKGKIAVFFGGESLLHVKFKADSQFSLRDEVLDGSPYIDNDHKVPMPFAASRYAADPEECDTLVIIISHLVSGDEVVEGKNYTHADTEVIIIDAKTSKILHIEYLGTCLAEVSSQNPWGSVMRGEAMLYLASLAVDGVASSKPYTTPFQAGPPKEISDEDWVGGMFNEGFLATGEFGGYNTLVIQVVERGTYTVSKQKVVIFVVKLYQIENNAISASVNYGATTIVSPHPDALSVSFDNGAATMEAVISYQDMWGTITLPGYAPVRFHADAAGLGPCRDCNSTGSSEGKTCQTCGGTCQRVSYKNLIL